MAWRIQPVDLFHTFHSQLLQEEWASELSRRSSAKSDAVVVDLYGLCGDRVLTISQYPRIATISFTVNGKLHSLRIAEPEPYAEVVRICDPECCRIVVVDRNREEPNCLEHGRYRIEFHTEDDLIGTFLADKVEIDTVLASAVHSQIVWDMQ